MTISSQICKRMYACNGHTRQWEIDFPFLSVADIHVYVTSPDGTETEITAGYEIDVLNKWVYYPTVASEQDPLAPGYTLTLVRRTPPTQQITLTQQGVLDAQELEEGYDKLTLLMQETQEQLARSLKYPVSSGKTSADADAFLTQLKADQTRTLEAALEEVSTAHSALQTALMAETSARQTADTNLAQRVQTLAGTVAKNEAARQSAEEALQTALAAEATARQNTDGALQTELRTKQAQLSVAQLAAVDSGVTASTVAQVQANQEAIAALDEELEEERTWQKPADWIDIRSGALPNSVYFLVGHSADYSQYPQFRINATVSTSGNTYDVFVDGEKLATTASGMDTTLDWGALYTAGTIVGGFDVTYPAALTTHVVRVTPTHASDTLSSIRTDFSVVKGVMWAHFTLTNEMNLLQFLSITSNVYEDRAPLFEALTAPNDELKVINLGGAFNHIKNIKTLPVFVGRGNTYANRIRNDYSFIRSGVKRLRFKDFYAQDAFGFFRSCTHLESIDLENCTFGTDAYIFENCYKLKRLPAPLNIGSLSTSAITNAAALEPTFLDLSQKTTYTRLDVRGSSTYPMRGLKGVTVSNEAPFTGTSPQINIQYTGLDRNALVKLFKSMPKVTNGQTCSVVGCSGTADLTEEDKAIVLNKGWSLTVA